MLFTKPAAIAAVALSSVAYAQNATSADPTAAAAALLGALTGAGLTGLAGLAATVANSTMGPALLAALTGGPRTLLAPTNGALSGVPMNVSSNSTLLAEVLLYHVLQGNSFNANNTVARSPAHTIARSSLTNSQYAQLSGNRSQAVVLTSNGQSINILQPSQNVTTQTPIVLGNLTVIPIDATLNLPPTLSGLLTMVAPQLAGLATTLMLVQPLEAIRGITIFAPNDAAIAAISGALPNFNSSTIATVLQNHVINGTAVYSTGLANGTVSAAGQPFTFSTNSTGTYVTSGMVTARVLSTDAIVANGVVHTIDQVLLNPASNATAAAAAASQAATATGAQPGVGPTGTAATGATATGAGASASSTARSGAFTNAQVGAWALAAAAVGAIVI